jgi:poly(A) polymerase
MSGRLWDALKLKVTPPGQPFSILGINGDLDSPMKVGEMEISCQEVLDVLESVALYIPDWMTEKFYQEWFSFESHESMSKFIYNKLEDESCFRSIDNPLLILANLDWKYMCALLLKVETYYYGKRTIGQEGPKLLTLPFFPEAPMDANVYELLYAQFSLVFDVVRDGELFVSRIPPCTIETQNVFWRAFFDALQSRSFPVKVEVEDVRSSESFQYIPEFLFWDNVYQSVKRMYPPELISSGLERRFILTFTSPTELISSNVGGRFNELSGREEYSEEMFATIGTSSLTSLGLFKPHIKFYSPSYALTTSILDTQGNRVPFPSFRAQDYIKYQPVAPPKQGLYDPVSLLYPTDEDKRDVKSMLLYIGKSGINLNINDSEKLHRKMLLLKINEIVKNETGDDRSVVLPFGSYVLGVDLPGSDIDLLCVIARGVDISGLFTSLETRLRSLNVMNLVLIPEATVPTIKFNIEGVDIDLIFSKLSVDQIPGLSDLEKDDILQGMEETSIRALNGYRVAQSLMSLVPNLDSWRLTLKIVKLWAKYRGIYGNSFGYVGGVTYALMVAFVCQLYPNATPSTLVKKFFLVFHKWAWPRAVQLNPLQKVALIENIRPSHLPPPEGMVWRQNKGANLMPIITPAFPAMNAAYNVNHSTLTLITAELDRGDLLFHREDHYTVWELLLERTNFFERYPYYIEVLILGETRKILELWGGYVESRLNKLSLALEEALAEVKGVSQPLPVSFSTSRIYTSIQPFSCSYFIGIDYSRTVNRSISISYIVHEFENKVGEWKGKTPEMSLRLKLFKRENLPDYINL